DPAEPGMEHGAGAGHRGRGAGPGDLYADERLRAGLPGVRGERETGLRRRLSAEPGVSHPRTPVGYLWTDEMSDTSFLSWPFFETRHRELAAALDAWAVENQPVDHGDVDAACNGLVASLGAAGFLRHSGAGISEKLDVRSLCLIRETLARHDALADFSFAMQGLGMGAVSLFGTAEQRLWLEKTRAGKAISAFAL